MLICSLCQYNLVYILLILAFCIHVQQTNKIYNYQISHINKTRLMLRSSFKFTVRLILAIIHFFVHLPTLDYACVIIDALRYILHNSP